MTTLTRCLAAAARPAGSVSKSDYPSRDEFDAAIVELADRVWKGDEPYHRAFARAMDSDRGKLLYSGRERSALPGHTYHNKNDDVPLSKSEKAIAAATKLTMLQHPNITYERALSLTLDANPELYSCYLSETP